MDKPKEKTLEQRVSQFLEEILKERTVSISDKNRYDDPASLELCKLDSSFDNDLNRSLDELLTNQEVIRAAQILERLIKEGQGRKEDEVFIRPVDFLEVLEPEVVVPLLEALALEAFKDQGPRRERQIAEEALVKFLEQSAFSDETREIFTARIRVHGSEDVDPLKLLAGLVLAVSKEWTFLHELSSTSIIICLRFYSEILEKELQEKDHNTHYRSNPGRGVIGGTSYPNHAAIQERGDLIIKSGFIGLIGNIETHLPDILKGPGEPYIKKCRDLINAHSAITKGEGNLSIRLPTGLQRHIPV